MSGKNYAKYLEQTISRLSEMVAGLKAMQQNFDRPHQLSDDALSTIDDIVQSYKGRTFSENTASQLQQEVIDKLAKQHQVLGVRVQCVFDTTPRKKQIKGIDYKIVGKAVYDPYLPHLLNRIATGKVNCNVFADGEMLHYNYCQSQGADELDGQSGLHASYGNMPRFDAPNTTLKEISKKQWLPRVFQKWLNKWNRFSERSLAQRRWWRSIRRSRCTDAELCYLAGCGPEPQPAWWRKLLLSH